MIRRPPRSTRTDTLFPYTTLFRSMDKMGGVIADVQMAPVSPLEIVVGFVLSAASCGLASGALVAVGTALLVDYSRSEEHTSELQSLMRISYAVFCLKKKTKENNRILCSAIERA